MQVDMTVFQPIENFFTEAATDFNNYFFQPAEKFFMQANTVIVSALYNIDMFVADIGNAVCGSLFTTELYGVADLYNQIEQDVIDEVMTVENLATSIGRQVTNDTNTVVSDIANEFNNVITPALNQVGQEIGQGLSVAGGDILQGLEVAGQYLENNPQLIVQIFLTVAIVSPSRLL
jgi:hypothetical protein